MTLYTAGYSTSLNKIAVHDINNDGFSDVVIILTIDYSVDNIYVYLASGDRRFTVLQVASISV